MTDSSGDGRAQAAQRKLDTAVEEFIAESDWGESAVLTAWILVAHQIVIADGEEQSSIPIVHMNGSQSDHIALGLLQLASDTIRGVGRWARDDEE